MQDSVNALRLLDVFVFGPLMIASAGSQRSPYFRTALTAIGIGTIVYNGAMYLQSRKGIAGQLAGARGQGCNCSRLVGT